MPSPRHQTRSRRGYTDHQIEALTVGMDWFHSFGSEPHGWPEGDNDQSFRAKREAWEQIGEMLTADWIKDRPFSRPWGWWKFSAPEQRRCLNCVHPFHHPSWGDEFPKLLSFGVPTLHGPYSFENRPEYESERDYLIRLNLLTDHERELLTQNQTPATAAPAAAG